MRGNVVYDRIGRDALGRPLDFEVVRPATPGRPPLASAFGCDADHDGVVDLQPCVEPPPPDPAAQLWYSGLYTYDLAGNIQQIGNDSFGYDELNRLVAAVMEAGGLDHSLVYQYDAFGNMLFRGRTGTDGTTDDRTYVVDQATNRLVSQHREHSLIGPSDLGYDFDPSGNMISAGDRGQVFDELGRTDAPRQRRARPPRRRSTTSRRRARSRCGRSRTAPPRPSWFPGSPSRTPISRATACSAARRRV